ncbi:MAG: hypothetical protein IPH58_19620 [Sphingobacteriales bacterium]|nr:hypothetical protein [Sphingobacteriales bacterium]
MNKKRGVKGGKKITGQQAAEVRRLIKDKMPDRLNWPLVYGHVQPYNSLSNRNMALY